MEEEGKMGVWRNEGTLLLFFSVDIPMELTDRGWRLMNECELFDHESRNTKLEHPFQLPLQLRVRRSCVII